MSKELIKKVTASAGQLLGMDPKDLIPLMEQWNKEKKYPFSPIVINVSEKGVTDNSADVEAFVTDAEAWADDIIKNALDLEEVTTAKKIITEFYKCFSETRKIQTAPLAGVVKKYTPLEGRLKTKGEELTKKIEAINEKEYQKREASIKDHILTEITMKEYTDIANLDMFKDFIENKRKINIFTSTGKLNKAIKDAVEDAIRIAVEPIIKERELNDKKGLQSKNFESYMENIKAEGNTEMLEANIHTLIRMKESVADLYPDIIDSCLRSIDNKTAMIQANIRSNASIAAAEEAKNADGETLKKLDEAKEALKDMTLSVTALKTIKAALTLLYPLAKFTETQEKVKAVGAAVAARIVDLEVIDATVPKEETKQQEAPQQSEEAEQPAFKYVIATEDINELDNMIIEAGSEAEAIEKFTQVFKAHLEMVGLIKAEG